MKTVIFDFDGTLTKRDTLRPFGHYLASKRKRYCPLILLYLGLIAYRFKIISDKCLKQLFLKLFIKDETAGRIHQLVNEFLDHTIPALLNEPVYAHLRRHLDHGDKVYIASANFDFFLEPLREKWHLSGLICTKTESDEHGYTGKIIGACCKKNDKLVKLLSVFGADNLKTFIAYGDKEDEPLLTYVAQGIEI